MKEPTLFPPISERKPPDYGPRSATGAAVTTSVRPCVIPLPPRGREGVLMSLAHLPVGIDQRQPCSGLVSELTKKWLEAFGFTNAV